MRKLIGLIAVLTLAVPALALAQEPPPPKNASQLCKEQRKAMGDAAFKALYGTNANKSNAHGKCVSMKAQAETAAEQSATIKAAKTCKAERKTLGETAFKAKYGTNANKSNAFGKCVSKLARA
jgi:hypothetical protein